MTAKEEIIKNLTVLTDNSCTSKLNFIYYDIIHECEIEFPAHSWEKARKAGYTFQQVLEKTKESTFNLLLWILRFDFNENDHTVFIKKIVLSSLWRPSTAGTSPHEDGRGLDIIAIRPNVGKEIVCSTVTKGEPGYFVKLRTHAMSQKLITQFFSPWTMYYYNSGGKLIEEPNNGITDNERIHLNHVHFTISK